MTKSEAGGEGAPSSWALRPESVAGPGSFWQNLTRGDLPLSARLSRIAANNWVKISRRQACCGHYGEPGC